MENDHNVTLAALRAGDVPTALWTLPADETWSLVHPEQDIEHGGRPMAVLLIGATLIIQMPTAIMGEFPKIIVHGHTDGATARECAVGVVQAMIMEGMIVTQGPLVDPAPVDPFAALVASMRNGNGQAQFYA